MSPFFIHSSKPFCAASPYNVFCINNNNKALKTLNNRIMKRTVALIIFYARFIYQVHAQDTIDTSAYIKNNPNVYAILIAKDHRLIKSSYYNHYDANSQFNDQSLTKSICSLLIGIAIEQHYIRSVDEKLVDFFPELNADSDQRKKDITLRQVMNQASGFYHEDLSRLYLFLKEAEPAQLVLRSPLAGEPGKEWHYNNAASHLLSVILTRATHMDTKTFADKFLFGPLGIVNEDWAKMRDGYYDGSGLLSVRLKAGDLLKIGQLLLDGGVYNGRQVVPTVWVKQILAPDITYDATWGFPDSKYALCWYHAKIRNTDFTYGMGWGGQFIVMIPKLKAVVIINESIADFTAVKQSVAFTSHIFPAIFDLLSSQ
jgi:CubicO group peptidase (beta-lactamase class C family)